MPLSTPNPRDQIVQHLPRLRAFALGLTRNPDRADDLVQDTVEKGWRHIASFTPGTNLCGWLCTILRNTYYSNQRKSWREVPDSDGLFVGQLSVRPAHDGVLAMREFMVAMSGLSSEHRDVIGLVGILGQSYEEASAVLGLPVGTVKSRVSRARGILAGLLNGGNDEPQVNLLPSSRTVQKSLPACLPACLPASLPASLPTSLPAARVLERAD